MTTPVMNKIDPTSQTLEPQIGQPLSGQQMQALQKQLAEKLVSITKDVELRKWAVDQACGLAGAAYEGEGADGHDVDVVHLARSIHVFLTEGTGAEGQGYVK